MANGNGDVWQVDEGESAYINVVLPNGTTKRVSRGTAFAAKMRELAKSAGLKKFAIFVDGKKINKSSAPNDFHGLKTVEIKKYDSAA
jgi:hypothetical protein